MTLSELLFSLGIYFRVLGNCSIIAPHFECILSRNILLLKSTEVHVFVEVNFTIQIRREVRVGES